MRPVRSYFTLNICAADFGGGMEENMYNEQEISIQKISPCIRYVNNIRFDSDFILPERIIYDHEFIFALSGEARFEYNGMIYNVEKSDLFFIKPNVKNTMYIDKGKNFHAHCVHFDWIPDEQFNFSADKYYMNRILSKEDLANLEKIRQRTSYEVSSAYVPTLIKGLDYDTIAPMFRELYNNFCLSDISSRLRERGIFMEILAELLSHNIEKHIGPDNDYHKRTINMALNYIDMHYHNKITTPLLAEQFGLSPKYFGVRFKSLTGISVQEYVTNVRMEAAKKLLLNTDIPLEDISAQIGIYDAVYFNKLFKHAEGISPGKYRKMLYKVSN